MQKILFLNKLNENVPLKSRSAAHSKWLSGVPFSTSDGKVFTKSDIDALHEQYERVVIQYDLGTMEI